MAHKIIHFLFFIALLFGLSYCANPMAPTGGGKDEEPPLLVTAKSTPNFQTNFVKKDIKFTFNEWIELKDAFNQIVISPPIKASDYDVKIKGKSIIFHFNDDAELLENVTYTINFGEAVRDITERNPVKNLRYVFSTGAYIDSLEVKGQLIDALTGEPTEGALFMLYENLADSVVRTIRPFYFGKTDTLGRFHIENVRAGTFKGFALKDEGLQNYLFDNPKELIGFPGSYITLGDSTTVSIDSTGKTKVKPVIIPPIKIFTEVQPLYITTVDSSFQGYLKLSFNREVEGLDLRYFDCKTPPIVEYDNDTLHFWYETIDSAAWTLIVKRDSLLNDTIPISSKGGKKATLKYIAKNSTISGRLMPQQPFEIAFSQPLIQFDTAFIHVKEDTTKTLVQPYAKFDTISGRKLELFYPWKALKIYDLEILPNGIKDLFGNQNTDTIRLKNIAQPLKSFGNIVLNIKNGQADTPYVIYILTEKNKIIATFKMRGAADFTFTKEILPPGKYHLKIITDLNDNGRWDTGNYDAHVYPEPVMERKMEQLRADWDVEVEVDLQSKKAN